MTSENLLSRPGDGPMEIIQTAEVPATQPANPLLVVHSLLRGRYWLAITLAIIGAVIGAPVGYFVLKPQYVSTGVIRIRPILPKILYQTEQNGVMPMFDSFVASQVAQIQSRRVIDEAMLQPEWKAQGRGLTPEAVAAFENSLTVMSPRASPLINVSFTDKNPTAAAIAVKSIIQTYERFYNDNETESGTPAMNLLENRRIELAAKLKGINDQILAIANDFGSSSLQEVFEFKLSELNHVESQLRQAQIDVALATAHPTTGPSTQAAVAMDAAAALQDPMLRDLIHQKMEAARQLKLLEAHYGTSHPKYEDAKALFGALDQQVQDRTDQLRKEIALRGPTIAGPAGGSPNRLLTKEQLQENQAALTKLYEDLKKETVDLGRKNLTIEQLRADAKDVQERLDGTKNRIEQLNLEKNVSGRISVISYGDIPLKPDKDRRAALTAVGGLGLAACGVGVVMLMGFMDRRMHHLDAARSRLKRVDRLLGVLPNLPSDLADPEQASSSAHCIHHIRAMLQIRQRATGHKTFAITSPSPGDGKTSLAITLGMSLAASGCRTLLIDCDMEGAGLTRKLERAARKLLGQILLDHGLIGESRLEESLEFARQNGIRLGKALVQLQYLSESQVATALSEQRQSAPGLGDVLNGASVQQAITSAGLPSLSILPLGSPPTAHSGRLSPDSMRRILDYVAPQFDVVLMDCGPILGSVEAAIVSAEADGVVLVVSRGGDRNAAENAVSLLMSAGAEIEGVVFNRAEASDVATSIFSSSVSVSVSQRPGSVYAQNQDPHVAAPVTAAVPPINFDAQEKQ